MNEKHDIYQLYTVKHHFFLNKRYKILVVLLVRNSVLLALLVGETRKAIVGHCKVAASFGATMLK